MSRIGIRPIKIENGISVEVKQSKVIISCDSKVKEVSFPEIVTVKVEDGFVLVNRKDNSKEGKSQNGLIARLITCGLIGVKEGFKKEMEFKGTGYRAAVEGKELLLNMGYSHEIRITIPETITVAVSKSNITVSGDDKQLVGQVAATIRNVREPEVYKGKGIKYKDEIIKRKAGKKASS